MQIFFAILVLLFAAGGAHGLKKCELPKPQIIDWSRMKGGWFNIINVGTPGDKVVKCLQLRNFYKVKNGFGYDMEDYHLHTGTYEGIAIRFKETKPGVYIIPSENLKKWQSIVKKDLPYVSKSLIKPTLKEAKELTTTTAVWYTDYKNYLIDFRCTADGNKYYWVMSRNPRPTAQDVLRITNVVAAIGKGWNAIQLYLSGCVTTRYDLSLFEHA